MVEKCIKCDVKLIIGGNWYKSKATVGERICVPCSKLRGNEYARKSYYLRGGMSMTENKQCASYLGIHVAEQALSKTFKDVEVMPPNNPGYDFICNKGKKIDVKSSCIRKQGGWTFAIRKNIIPDHFLCIAFDNREDLNPLHMWLIPSVEINYLTSLTIRVDNVSVWDDYKLDVGAVVECCNEIKGDV